MIRCSSSTRHRSSGQQRGVVLFVALIGMVVLSLAAVALMRAVDTGVSIAGNLTFKQAAIGPINYAVEQANYNLFDAPAASRIVNPWVHAPAFNYYANLQAGESGTGIPAGVYGPGYVYPGGFTAYTDPTTGYEVRWIIERMCLSPYQDDPLLAVGLIACDLLEPKVSKGQTTMKLGPLKVPPQPLYRVTIRIDHPTSNTVTYAQAVLR